MSEQKKKITLYVNEEVVKQIKILAINNDLSLSQLTENLFIEKIEKENNN